MNKTNALLSNAGQFPLASLPDDRILEIARNAENGPKFRKLFDEGDWSDYTGSPDYQQHAHFALCSMLIPYVGKDPVRIDRLFRRSALLERSPGWARKEGYLEGTIRKAIKEWRPFPRGEEFYHSSHSSHSSHGCTLSIEPPPESRPTDVRETEDEEAAPPPGRGEGDLGLDIATDYAQTHGQVEEEVAVFELCRRLRRLADDPAAVEGAVEAYCRLTGHDFAIFLAEFTAAWPKIFQAAGEDVVEWSVFEADAHPYGQLPRPPEKFPHYARLASIAWHLARAMSPKPIFLPQNKLAQILGVSQRHVSTLIGLLVTDGVLECVDENYSFAGKAKAKAYRFVPSS
jgi:hypothetical protein